jgi:hypothetical protein
MFASRIEFLLAISHMLHERVEEQIARPRIEAGDLLNSATRWQMNDLGHGA